ncbi:MAG: hypothetical protein KDI49_11060, partial [Gammaproteobacteria bacterium]|nr:hypothetical protein [Gammaproteobacteria bacterium]
YHFSLNGTHPKEKVDLHRTRRTLFNYPPQLPFSCRIGCSTGQGYLYGKALPPERFAEKL